MKPRSFEIDSYGNRPRPACLRLRWEGGVWKAVCGLLALGLASAGGCDEPSQTSDAVPPGPAATSLFIVTPHNETIRNLFAEEFSEWHEKRYGNPVRISWHYGGTGECIQYVEAAAQSEEMVARGLIPDVLFGGGVPDHRLLVERKLALSVKLPESIMGELPRKIDGSDCHDPDGFWHASALTGFGILCNVKACRERGIVAPVTWSELADPALFGWVGLADPTLSSSTKESLGMILQKYGWEEGWRIILRIAANARALLLSSTDVISNVSAGESLAGIAVNFNAMSAIARAGGEVLSYTRPAHASAFTPDAITVLNESANPQVAKRFVEFCLSEEGQALWSVKPEFRGSFNECLNRYAIVPSMYSKYAGKMAVEDNPFAESHDFQLDPVLQDKRSRVIAPLLSAACGDNHILLQRCWRKVIDHNMDADLLARLTEPPVTEEKAYELADRIAADPAQTEQLHKEWSERLNRQFQAVLQD